MPYIITLSLEISNRKSAQLITTKIWFCFPSDSWNQSCQNLFYQGKRSVFTVNAILHSVKSSTLKIHFFLAVIIKIKILVEYNSIVKAMFFLKNLWRKNVLGIGWEAQIIHECGQTGEIFY